MELSEYERKRLENIKENERILRSLNIPKIPIPLPPTHSGVASATRRFPHKQKAELPSRRSTRLIERQTGVKVMEEKEVERERSVIVKPAKSRPVITSRVAFSPILGATDNFMSLFHEKEHSEKKYDIGDLESNYRLGNEHCVIKVARDRIYSMAIHPSASEVIAAAGTKSGELAFWRATKVLSSDYLVSDPCTPEVYLFSPHSGSLSNLRFSPIDPHKLYTTCYDGSCLLMDLHSGSFTPWTLSASNAFTTGFDLSPDGHLAFYSDTDGFFRVTDLRTNECVLSEQLHLNKIGGVSVSPAVPNTIATCSNDRSVCVWDFRKLSSEAHLFKYEYRNAVTAVSFHPSIGHLLASTCYDDHIRLHDVSTGGTLAQMPHNNQTGRWVTLFKALWDPKSSSLERSLLMIGNMEKRAVDLYDGHGIQVGCAMSEWVTAQPAVNAAHPGLNVIASGNASGKICIWST